MSVAVLPELSREERVVLYLRENAVGNSFFTSVLSQFDRFGRLSENQLGAVERNMARPARVVAPNPVTEVGMYRTADGVFRVKVSRESGNLYAMKYNPEAQVKSERFSYARGGIYRLSAGDRLTLAEAQALGHEFGICCVCGAELSDPVSVARGIGPVCVRRV